MLIDGKRLLTLTTTISATTITTNITTTKMPKVKLCTPKPKPNEAGKYLAPPEDVTERLLALYAIEHGTLPEGDALYALKIQLLGEYYRQFDHRMEVITSLASARMKGEKTAIVKTAIPK